MIKMIKQIAFALAMSLVIVQPAHAFAQYLVPLMSKVISKIIESSASQPKQSLPDPLTPEAITRGVPEGTRAATMSPPQGRNVLMDGQLMRLAPGSKILDSKNRIVLPGRIPQSVAVRYSTDYLGNVSTIWLLSDPQYTTSRSTATREDTSSVTIAKSEDRR